MQIVGPNNFFYEYFSLNFQQFLAIFKGSNNFSDARDVTAWKGEHWIGMMY